MAEIKCPACWNDIPEESENCPCCGFLLKSPQQNNSSINYNFQEKKVTEHGVNFFTDNLETRLKKEKKNKQIIGIAVALVAVIVIAGVVNSNSQRRNYAKSNSNYNYDYSYSGGSTSYAKTGKEGALNKAKSYLNSSAFSYTGLIEQLEYEGFSNSEATYGADNCGANWKDQALKKAKSYLTSSAFSESGLQEQLEYEGITY